MLGSTDMLRRTWYEMENGAPFLFIDNFEIDGRALPRPDRMADCRHEFLKLASNACWYPEAGSGFGLACAVA